MIRIFVGTDERSEPAERVLEYSIGKHASEDYEIIWMRHGDPLFTDWTISSNLEWPWTPKGLHCWGTRFSCFRYAVPELAGFQGREIYLDSDMILLADIAELWRLANRAARPWLCQAHSRLANGSEKPKPALDVSVIDCSALYECSWWPRIEVMKKRWSRPIRYARMLAAHNMLELSLPQTWNRRDHVVEDDTKLLHISDVRTQPWRPWPEHIEYEKHPSPAVLAIWEQHLAAARAVLNE